MDITRTGIEFGPIDLLGLSLAPKLHFYGLLIVVGILVASTLIAWLAKRDGRDPDHVWNGLVWAVVGGIIGARLWFIFFPPVSSVEAGQDTWWMLGHPLSSGGALDFFSGGLGIFGALIGGIIAVALYARRKKLTGFWAWIDMAIVGFPLGHAIGRWGNYVNQELYGKPTSLPWGIQIDNPPLEYATAEAFHPLFLYESLWNLILCSCLVWLWLNYRHGMRRGDFVLIYIVGYGVVRFFLEFLRVETAEVPGIGINSSQTITAISAIIAGIILFYRYKIAPLPKQTYHTDGRPVGKAKKAKS